MRTLLCAVAALLASGGAAFAQDAGLDGFRAACIEGRANYETALRTVQAAGFTPVADDAHPYLARILAMARGAELPDANAHNLQAYANADRSVYLALSDVTVSGMRVNGCYYYDFAAPGPMDLEPLQTWLGPPTTSTNEHGVIAHSWTGPAALPNVATLRSYFIEADGATASVVGFSGAALAVTSVSQQSGDSK